MRNISFKQILLVILLFFFFFGDFRSLKKKLNESFKYINNFIFKKDKKKGT